MAVYEGDKLIAAGKFTELTDAPDAITAGFLKANSGRTGLEFDNTGGPAVGSALGRLVGRTTVLPTAVVARGVNLGPNPGIGNPFTFHWTNQPSGYNQVGLIPAVNVHQQVLFFAPLNAPSSDVFGLWFRSKVGSVYKQTIGPFPWGAAPLTDETSTTDAAKATLLFGGGGTNDGESLAKIEVEWQVSAEGHAQVVLNGDGTALPANSTVEIYEAVVRGPKGDKGEKGDQGDAGTGGAGRSFVASAAPAADTTITLTGSSAGAWGESDLATTRALAAGENGKVLIIGKIRVQIVTDSTGGGDRYKSEIDLIRTRNSVSTVVQKLMVYGPRNLSTLASNTSDAWSDASQITDAALSWYDEALVGDTFTVRGRCLTQIETGTREVMFVAAQSGIIVVPVG